MKNIFINLKRFEVSRSLGGVCDVDSPKEWIEGVLEECVKLGLGAMDNAPVVFFLPEALIIPAMSRIKKFSSDRVAHLSIGSQGVHREDIKQGKNFGAFTTMLPATAAKAIGCQWTMVGHSEERKNIQGIIEQYAQHRGASSGDDATSAINLLLNQEVLSALNAGLDVLYCVGETAEEKGPGTFEEQSTRVKSVLQKQLRIGLAGIDQYAHDNRVAVAYEPVWAIGPGKIPPDAAYIEFVASFIKSELKGLYGSHGTVVYGGGLKEENAGEIAQIRSIDGGLVALTRFKGDIGFYPSDLRKIIDKYLH